MALEKKMQNDARCDGNPRCSAGERHAETRLRRAALRALTPVVAVESPRGPRPLVE